MGLVGERALVFVLNIAVTITRLIPIFWGSIPMTHYGSFDGYQVLLLIGYLGLFVGWGVLRLHDCLHDLKTRTPNVSTHGNYF
jgi:hypothetical protein